MTEERAKRKLAAIFSADVKGYSRLMADDEEATVRTINSYREVMTGLIKAHGGGVVDAKGDNVLAEFPSVVDAVRSAVEVQKELKKRNSELPEHRRMEFRIGINLGDVIDEEGTIYGDGVNVAARLEGLADGGGICISGTAFDHVKNRVSVGYEYQGKHTVKNLPDPVRVYKVLMEPDAAGRVIGDEEPRRTKRRWVVVPAVAVLAVVGVGLIWNFYLRPDIEPASIGKMAFPLPEKPSIAVLPFANMTGDPSQEYLPDGITENIITVLSASPKLFVIARNSTFAYKGKSVKVQQVAEDLGVRYLLEGSVARSGDRIRVTAQLIDAITGHHLWAERYDRELKDLFALQDYLAKKILTGIGLKLTQGEEALHGSNPNNIDVLLKLFQGTEYLRAFNIDANNRARLIAEECIELEPDYWGNYWFLGGVHMMDYFLGSTNDPMKSLQTAIGYMEKAAGMTDAGKGRVYPYLAFLYALKKDYDKAIELGEKAIAMVPNGADAHAWLAMSLTWAGRAQKALPLFEKAMRLNPMPPAFYYLNFGHANLQLGRFEEAVAMYKKTIALTPNNILAYVSLAGTYGLMGKEEESKAAGAEVLRISPKWSIEYYAKTSVSRDKERLIEGFRKAGLPEHPPLPIPDKPSIAVLPFVNMSDDPKQEFFADGLAEEIINGLAKLSKLFVIARNSSFKYKGKTVDVREVGRELGVRYVLEGSVRREAQRVRVTAQLIEASTGNHLFSERYDRELKEIFATQDEITLAILRALRVAVTSGEQARLIGRGTKSLDAYLKAIQANEQFLQMNRQGSIKAKELAQEAIGLDPNYAFPYAVLANAYMLDVWFRFSESPEESMRLADEAAHKALDLDETDLLTQSALTNLYVMQRKHDNAIASAERALEFGPGAASSQRAMGIALYFACRFQEAIPFFEESIRLDPYPPSTSFRTLAGAYGAVGRHKEALKLLEKSLQMNPDDIFAHLSRAALLVELDREDDARAEVREVLRLHPRFSLDHFAKTLTFKDQAFVDRRIDLMRKAGLK